MARFYGEMAGKAFPSPIVGSQTKFIMNTSIIPNEFPSPIVGSQTILNIGNCQGSVDINIQNLVSISDRVKIPGDRHRHISLRPKNPTRHIFEVRLKDNRLKAPHYGGAFS